MKTEAEDWRFAQGHTASQWSGPDDKGRALPVWSLTVRSTALPLWDPREGGLSEIRGGPRSALRSLGLKESPLAPELCDCKFSEYFSGREEGAFLERKLPRKEPESLVEVAAGGLEPGEQRVPRPTTLDSWGASRAGAWGQQQRCWFRRSSS